MKIETGDNRPPLKELQGFIEAAGYYVMSINAEHDEFGWGKLRFTGVIDLKIAPAKFFPRDEGFPCFTKPPPCLSALAVKCHECIAQFHQQERSNEQG
jgi:hypothetical protein